MASGAAKRYTEAVFDIAREKGSFDQWQHDLDALAGLMSDDGAALVLNSPKISQAQKMSLIQEALRGAQPEAINLATLFWIGVGWASPRRWRSCSATPLSRSSGSSSPG